ncbi:MAG: Crp/Fnr family transcriptional regulator [Nitrospirota bacterium]
MEKPWYYTLIDFRKIIDPKYLNEIKPLFYKKNELIYGPGDKSDCIYLVSNGIVKIFSITVTGKETSMSLRYPGDIFGLAEIYGSECRFCFAGAYKDATIYPIKKDLLTTMINENPEIAIKIIEFLGKRLLEKEIYIEHSVVRNVEARVAHLLVKIAIQEGECCENGFVKINFKLTHQTIADLVGASRQTVTEALNNLKDEGLIILTNKEILIKDLRLLAKHVGTKFEVKRKENQVA